MNFQTQQTAPQARAADYSNLINATMMESQGKQQIFNTLKEASEKAQEKRKKKAQNEALAKSVEAALSPKQLKELKKRGMDTAELSRNIDNPELFLETMTNLANQTAQRAEAMKKRKGAIAAAKMIEGMDPQQIGKLARSNPEAVTAMLSAQAAQKGQTRGALEVQRSAQTHDQTMSQVRQANSIELMGLEQKNREEMKFLEQQLGQENLDYELRAKYVSKMKELREVDEYIWERDQGRFEKGIQNVTQLQDRVRKMESDNKMDTEEYRLAKARLDNSQRLLGVDVQEFRKIRNPQELTSALNSNEINIPATVKKAAPEITVEDYGIYIMASNPSADLTNQQRRELIRELFRKYPGLRNDQRTKMEKASDAALDAAVTFGAGGGFWSAESKGEALENIYNKLGAPETPSTTKSGYPSDFWNSSTWKE